MTKCKVCKVPLDGFLSKIPRFIFRIKPSDKDSQVCNKCESKQANRPAKKASGELTGEKYKCQICKRMIHEVVSLEHAKAEEYIIGLIKKDHSHWQHKEPTCQDCVEYYRQLVNKTEI